MREDPRLNEAKAMPITQVVEHLQIAGLKRAGGELMGPCPVCGGVDRFSINPNKNLFNCRHCGGGDGIKLVELVQNCDFKTALSFLCGETDAALDSAEVERRRRTAERQREHADREAKRYRVKAIADARRIWEQGGRSTDVVAAYLDRRGIQLPSIPLCLRFLPEHKYYQQVGQSFDLVHTGPCMLAAIQQPNGRFCGVHQTWLDLDQANGKARIVSKDGRVLESKKVRGTKKGGAIRLSGSGQMTSSVMVMGEGIETTLTAMIAGVVPDAMYWAGVDLGNMSGRMVKVQGKKWSGLPDMADSEAFYPPPCVERLVFIQDGDSQATMTRAKLESGLQRAMVMNEGLVGQIVHPGKGVDLNDVLMGKGEQ